MNATHASRALCLTLAIGSLAACGGAEMASMNPTVDPIVGSWQDTEKGPLGLTLGADGFGGMSLILGSSSDASLAGCSSIASAGFTWKAAPYRVVLPNDAKMLVHRTGCKDPSKNVSPAGELAMDDPDLVPFGIAVVAAFGAFGTEKTMISVSGDKMTVSYDLAGNSGNLVLARRPR